MEGQIIYTVYFAFGFHYMWQVTEEEFERVKEFYKLVEHDGQWTNARNDIYAWEEKKEKNWTMRYMRILTNDTNCTE